MAIKGQGEKTMVRLHLVESVYTGDFFHNFSFSMHEHIAHTKNYFKKGATSMSAKNRSYAINYKCSIPVFLKILFCMHKLQF